MLYDPRGTGAQAYQALAKEFLRRHRVARDDGPDKEDNRRQTTDDSPEKTDIEEDGGTRTQDAAGNETVKAEPTPPVSPPVTNTEICNPQSEIINPQSLDGQ